MGLMIDKIRMWFCNHEWELLCKNEVWNEDISKDISVGYKYTYLCKKCLKSKTIDI